MGEDRQIEPKTGLSCDNDSTINSHTMTQEIKSTDINMDWSNCNCDTKTDGINGPVNDTKTDGIKGPINDTKNQVSLTKPQDEVKYRRVSESSVPHSDVHHMHHVKRRVLNGGVSPVTEETYRLDLVEPPYRSRSQTPTRELSRQKTRINQASRHLPTWDIIDTDADR